MSIVAAIIGVIFHQRNQKKKLANHDPVALEDPESEDPESDSLEMDDDDNPIQISPTGSQMFVNRLESVR